MTTNETNTSVALEIIRASEIEPKEVKWLWYPYIPFGKVTLLQGDPGDGKSKLMLSLAALLSKGEALPFVEDENALAALPEQLTACGEQLENAKTQLATAKIEVDKPFPREAELKTKTARLDELNILLNMDKRENEIGDTEPDEDAPTKSTKEMER